MRCLERAACTLLIFLAAALAGAAATPLVPVHGEALRVDAAAGRATVALDAAPGMLVAGSYAVKLAPHESLERGESFDGLLERGGMRLRDTVATAAFTPGLPNSLISHIVASGDALPDAALIDQRDEPVRLADFRGKTLLLSFVYSRCPDETICPAISAKFAYLQRHLDPATFHLALVTLDPANDSPAVLRRYGATFGADPQRWSLLTGRGYDVKNLLDSFAISSIRNDRGDIVHDERLAIVDPRGIVTDLIPSAGWNPDDVIAQARAAAGLASNPLRRFELASLAGIVALCGGSTTTGIVVLDSVVFLGGVAVLGSLLVWFGRRIFAEE